MDEFTTERATNVMKFKFIHWRLNFKFNLLPPSNLCCLAFRALRKLQGGRGFRGWGKHEIQIKTFQKFLIGGVHSRYSPANGERVGRVCVLKMINGNEKLFSHPLLCVLLPYVLRFYWWTCRNRSFFPHFAPLTVALNLLFLLSKRLNGSEAFQALFFTLLLPTRGCAGGRKANKALRNVESSEVLSYGPAKKCIDG